MTRRRVAVIVWHVIKVRDGFGEENSPIKEVDENVVLILMTNVVYLNGVLFKVVGGNGINL